MPKAYTLYLQLQNQMSYLCQIAACSATLITAWTITPLRTIHSGKITKWNKLNYLYWNHRTHKNFHCPFKISPFPFSKYSSQILIVNNCLKFKKQKRNIYALLLKILYFFQLYFKQKSEKLLDTFRLVRIFCRNNFQLQCSKFTKLSFWENHKGFPWLSD